MATAFAKIRSVKSCSFLTHGGDNYDHKGMKKARRSLDAHLIQEGLDEIQPTETKAAPTAPETFRVIVYTQVYENYGSRWKAKGGNEHKVTIGGVHEVIALGSKGIQKIVDCIIKKLPHADWSLEGEDALHQCDESAIGWEVRSSNDLTELEEMDREWAFMRPTYKEE